MGVLFRASSVANKVKRVLKKPVTEVKPKGNCLKRPSLANEKVKSKPETVVMSKPVLGTKRKSEDAVECQKAKRVKMDHCQDILAKLMKHDSSCLFLVPVDPNVSRNEYYFLVIKHPMDLGTIQKKLQQNKYNGDEEFEADVRLVFANAMLYHPPNHWVHQIAVKLSRFFDILWMPVKEQARRDTILSSRKSIVKTTCEKDKRSDCPEAVPKHSAPTERASDLKARFADTILRAQTKLISLANATNVAASQEEKERLRRKQNEASSFVCQIFPKKEQLRVRIEAEAKAAELAYRKKAEAKLKIQRQQEREAARASLEKMERSINLDDNFRAMRELEALIGNLSEYGRTRNPLEHLGLYIKEEYSLGHDYDYEKRCLKDIDLEEGEIAIEAC